MFGILKKFFPKKEKKSSDFAAFISGSAYYNDTVNVLSSLNYYTEVSPVATATDLVADEFKAIAPCIFNGETLDPISPVLDFLARPNKEQNRQDFFKELSSFFLITGNVFIIIRGKVDGEPISMRVISPEGVTTNSGNEQSTVESYTLSSSQTFHRTTVGPGTNKRIAYLSEINKSDSATTQELFHIKDFNPRKDEINTRVFGASRLNSLFLELEQHKSFNIHNLALLKNGAKVSGILSSKEDLTPDTFDSLQEQMRLYQGEEATGRVFMSSTNLDFKETTMKNTDMDFRDLKNSIKEDIYTRLKIPLPLVMPGRQTLNNLGEAKLALYDNNVLPLANKLFGDLTFILRERFNLSDNEFITYNENTIPALENRRMEKAKKMKELSVFSDNEVRQSLAFEPYENGDLIYKPQNLLPVGADSDPEANVSTSSAQGKRKGFFDFSENITTKLDEASVELIQVKSNDKSRSVS